MENLYRIDLHVHSCFSDKSPIWAIQKMNCPESYTSPEFIYDTAKRMGMNYVTITDHNTIHGVLEIAHLPETFISVEIDTCFPENNCKVHVVVLDISENIFKEIMYVRKNIYDLVAYLRKTGLVHFVAHPLFDMNGKLTAENVEKMLLLFDVFEVKNGIRAGRFNKFIQDIISSLTKEKYESIVNKYTITQYGITPWKKSIVGGSDDHSGLFIAKTYTVSPDGDTLKGFISSIKAQRTWAEGEDGGPLVLAHNIYGIWHSFYMESMQSGRLKPMPFVTYLLKSFFTPGQKRNSLMENIRLCIRKNMPEFSDNPAGKTFMEILDREAKRLIKDKKLRDRFNNKDKSRRIFEIISYLTNRMISMYSYQLMGLSFRNSIFNAIQLLGNIGIIHFFTSPFYITYYYQHKSKRLMDQLRKTLKLPDDSNNRNKIALFTDTVNEVNGVTVILKKLLETAHSKGIDLTLITCSDNETSFENGVKNFKSVGNFALPGYHEYKLHFPPILDVIDFVEREGYTRIHTSTPGTLGLAALLISKVIDIPISATYHTDIPHYVLNYTDDTFLEKVAWNYMTWFYNQMENVFVPSASTKEQIIEKGISPEKVKLLPRWVDSEIFSPAKSNPCVWEKYNLDGEVKVLYVGRVSKEKNLGLLAEAFIDIIKAGCRCNLIIVGDGPYKNELESKLRGYPVLFTGFLAGEELSNVYASSDVFVFPSTSDTFGNVVLEAQASGLPVIVSDEGGPKELILHEDTGFIIKANDRSALVNALSSLLTDRKKIKIMGKRARQFVEIYVKDPEDMCMAILRL